MAAPPSSFASSPPLPKRPAALSQTTPHLGEPTERRPVAELSQAAVPELDFRDTQTAFAHLDDDDLRHTARLFRLMNSPTLVRVGSALGAFAVRYGLPFAERITLATIYRQFVGGRTLLEVEQAARRLAKSRVLSVLDFGAEGKNDEQAYNTTMTECIRALEFAGLHRSVPVVSTKISGLTADSLLVAVSEGRALTAVEEAEYAALRKRVDAMCHVARERGVQLYVDAEESWMQPAIDKVCLDAMRRYNGERAVVVNTYQLYRHDRLGVLQDHHAACRSRDVVFGAKLVRGAYMVKERARAEELGYPSPIQPDKASTDRDFDAAVAYCLRNLDSLEFVNASHNEASARRMAELMHELGIRRDDARVMFCQLYGMSDNLTYVLADAGYRVGKYLVYGPVKDVVPYLVRRAQENTSVTGEASRELQLVQREIDRRRLARGDH